jgi:hypothetical protein
MYRREYVILVIIKFVHYSAYDDKLKRSCHLPAPSRYCMTHGQERQDFLGTSQVSIHKNNKINLIML